MASPFNDYFSGHSGTYAAARPGYPDTLFAFLAAEAPGRRLAWDCGTGNGQAALGLARWFERIVATDASQAQIEHAMRHPRVGYHVAPAEAAPLGPASADLVTVAQALHWFDLGRFYAEVRRVLVPGGIVAAWTYGLLTVSPEVDAIVERFYRDVVGPYWPPERRHVESGYQTLPFPFDAIDAPAFEMRHEWDRSRFVAYLQSWSSSQRYRERLGLDPVDCIRDDIEAVWPRPDETRTIRWLLPMRIGRRA